MVTCYNPAHAVNNDDTGVAFVVAEGVGTVTHDESREMVLLGKTVSVRDFGRMFYFKDVAGRAAESHGGKT